MRFNLPSTALSSHLLSLSRVINSKNTLAILNSFLFEVRNGQLAVTASDSENVMQTALNLDNCEGEGRFAVNNQTIMNAVKELPEQPLSISVSMEEQKITIDYQNGSANFPIQNADEYPQTKPLADDATSLSVDAAILSDNITRSLFATANDEIRPVMNGIYFDLTQDALAVVASDGHKLVRNLNFNIKTENPKAFIMPKKPATLLKNTIARDSGNVVIRFDDKQAEVSYADGKLTCRLIEGRYPNYNSVIPTDNPNEMTIDRRSLIGALRRVLPFASDSSELVKFHMENGTLQIDAEDLDFATNATEHVTCEYGGMPMSIGFKGSSMLEILNNLEGDNVIIKLADPSRGGIVVPEQQPENQEVLMLIMPMLLND